MQEENLIFPQDIYYTFLSTINSIKLSKREIDIIACILNGRTAKGIASLLSISPKTAEAHTYNMMKKLGCLSRESLISLIESSDKLLILKKYYLALLTFLAFEQTLRDVAKLQGETGDSCLIAHWDREEKKNLFLCNLKSHLELVGIKTSFDKREAWVSLEYLASEPRLKEWTLYVLPREVEGENALSSSKRKVFLSEKVLFLSINKKAPSFSSLRGMKIIYLSESRNYYFFVFNILKQMLSVNNLSLLIERFNKKQGFITSETKASSHPLSKEILTLSFIKRTLMQRKWQMVVLSFVCLIALTYGAIRFYLEGTISFFLSNQLTRQTITTIARSDLNLPKETIFLNRSDLITQIDNKLKNQLGIQTIALVGMGGVGKTILARHYAHQQNASVIWEINAETRESLKESFENLASALSKKEEDKKILRGLQEIKNPIERETKIIQFVKEHLRSYLNWFLIYDNVEKFIDIQKYFPSDYKVWGKGKVIITTRDNSIKNSNAIHIGELNEEEKLSLFMSIMRDGDVRQFTQDQREHAQRFLKEIPSFPLDISTASYYIKITNISYENYLDRLKKYNKDFALMQIDLLKEAREYTKTRHSIITLSLKKIIDTHKDFEELLLFISLLDSQNIPRDLLNTYNKNEIVVDNFIYHLKKYSLITSESPASLNKLPLFSIHRSTQEISLNYLTKVLKLKDDKKILQSIVNSLESYISLLVDTEDSLRMKFLINHAEVFLSHHSLLTDMMNCSVEGYVGSIFFYLSDYVKAKEKLEKSLINLNKNYMGIANTFVHLGSVYRSLGNYEKGKEALEQGLEIYKTHFETHLGMARALAYLGMIYRELGKYKAAKEVLEESIIIYKKKSLNHIGLARALGYLGTVYRSLGNYGKAKEVLEQSLVSHKMVFGDCNIRTAWVLVYLGTVYRCLGNYQKAQDLLEQSLMIYKKHFSENHIDVAWVLVRLGNVYKELGNYKKAKETLEQSLMIYKKHFSENHIDIAWALTYLGTVYERLGNHEKAQQLLKNSLMIYRINFPNGHTRIDWILKHLKTKGA